MYKVRYELMRHEFGVGGENGLYGLKSNCVKEATSSYWERLEAKEFTISANELNVDYFWSFIRKLFDTYAVVGGSVSIGRQFVMSVVELDVDRDHLELIDYVLTCTVQDVSGDVVRPARDLVEMIDVPEHYEI